MRWDDAFLERLVTSSLLRYLAVAHYGRGRGELASTASTLRSGATRSATRWPTRHAEFAAILAMRGPTAMRRRIDASLQPLLRGHSCTACSLQLYPGALVEAT